MTVQLTCAVFLTALGCALLQGEIHTSILVTFGEILTFVGALFGIDYHYKFTDRS